MVKTLSNIVLSYPLNRLLSTLVFPNYPSMSETHQQVDSDLTNAYTELKSALVCVVTTWVFAFIFFGLRMASRIMSKAGLWWDDWLMILAMI